MLKSFGVGWWWWVAHKILVSAPVPLELILTGFDWVGAGPCGGLGFGTGLDNIVETPLLVWSLLDLFDQWSSFFVFGRLPSLLVKIYFPRQVLI